MGSITYQPHIDGLRALAVLLVLFHHLGDLAGVTGGYVGVDVFFVISGFLITSIVRAEIESGSFSLSGFYKRRVVRLAPAYFIVLLVTSIAALIWMLPAELVEYSKSAIASSLFLANFYMWREVGGYFGVSADTTPLLHLWSLALEEQFYLFWPVALVIGHRWIGLRSIPILLLLTAVGGVVISEWGVTRYPAAGYYLLPTRFYELALGALLAYLPVSKASISARLFTSVLGLLMIVYASMSFGKETLFPGYSGLIPTLGTAMLLRWGGGTALGKLLSMQPIVALGRISYPAYLWHWPIIVFLNLNEVKLNLIIIAIVIIATIVLAWITYRLVELPARRLLVLPTKRIILFGAGLPIVASVAAAMIVISLHGLPKRFPESLNIKSTAILSYPNKMRGRCNEGPPTAPLPPDECILGRKHGEVDFLLVGDSHANHFTGFLDELGKDADLRGYDMTRSQTAFLPHLDFWTLREGFPDHHENFKPRNQYISDLLKNNKYRYVVFASSWIGYFNSGSLLKKDTLEGEDAFKYGMRAAIDEAYNASGNVIIINMIPGLVSDMYNCSLRTERFGLDEDCTFSIVQHNTQTAGVRAFFDQLRLEYPNIEFIDPTQVMCENSICYTEMDGIPLYRDNGHLNDLGSRLLARKWLNLYGNPLLKSEVKKFDVMDNALDVDSK